MLPCGQILYALGMWPLSQNTNVYHMQGCRFLSKGWGGCGSQIDEVATTEALSAWALGFLATFLRCSEMHPEQFLSNLSA